MIKHIIGSCIALVICLLIFEFTHIDLWVQNFLFNADTNEWLLSTSNTALYIIFYSGIKKVLIIFALALLACLLLFKHKPIIKHYQHRLWIVFLSLLLVPAIIGGIKNTSNIACPNSLINYGGNIPYISIFEHYPDTEKPKEKQRCFPAGHASGGFALLSLFFLFSTRINRKRAIVFSLTVGWLMGGYKMAIGHHFLSHTLVSMILAWLIINCTALACQSITKNKELPN